MIDFIKLFISGFLSFIVFDYLWFSVVAENIYRSSLGNLMKDNISLTPAIAVYILLSLATVAIIWWFPSSKPSLVQAVLSGAFLGLVVYGVYEFTNSAIITNWPVKIVIIDIVWGMVATSLVAVVIWFVNNNL